MDGRLLTPRARHWLSNSQHARILHLFDGVCNLVNDRKELLSLVSPPIGPGPFTLVVDGLDTSDLDASQPVSVTENGRFLHVSLYTIDTLPAQHWLPTPKWAQVRDPSLWEKWHTQAVSALGKAAMPLARRDVALLHLLLKAISGADTAGIQAAVRQLAGRGPGLTPTGDDILVGALHALWVWQKSPAAMKVIAQTAVPLTTTLSGAFLEAAAAGEATWQWHDLVNGCAHAPAQILHIGQSSGADAWAGFIHTLRFLEQRQGAG